MGVKSTLEGEIQERRIKKAFDDIKDSDQIENSFLHYLIDIEQTKAKDEELCQILFEL